jgi:DNA-binding transcriptional LysR family regulator
VDTEILRTFLEVNRTRHFARAADNLYLTQAAVSARIRQLEAQVGARLFSRNRNNIQLTPAGYRLVPHAEAALANWNRALLEVGAETDGRALVALGCLPSLREIFLDDWLSELYRADGASLLQIELLNSATLISRVREQSLSLALLYEPPQTRDLEATLVAELNLILVSSRRGVALEAPIADFVGVDWGTSVRGSVENFLHPDSTTVLRVDTPMLAYRFLQNIGGTAVLPLNLVAADLRRRRLFRIGEAPALSRSVYLIRSATAHPSRAEAKVAAALTTR